MTVGPLDALVAGDGKRRSGTCSAVFANGRLVWGKDPRVATATSSGGDLAF
jgi:hypothetical protein